MLNLSGFSVRYGEVLAVDGVTAQAAPGEIVGLIGPNGSGKSSLLKALAGLQPFEGEASWKGQPLKTMAARRRGESVSYVPQQVAFAQPFRAEEIVQMGCFARLDRWGSWTEPVRQAVNEALKRVDAEHLSRRTVTGLSGGEAQRIRLAQALAQGAEMLLLDEPTSALDLHHQLELTALLRGLQDEGKTQVIALHDLNLARQLCSQLWLLERGRLRCQGPPETVLLSPEFRQVYAVSLEIFSSPGGDFVVWPKKIDQT